MDSRAERERKAYDEDRVFEINTNWHKRFLHVFQCPNTTRHERLFERIIRLYSYKKHVLDIGCGQGVSSRSILEYGAEHVHGIDISESFIKEAKKNEIKERLVFSLQDLSTPFKEKYDLIVGRSILHHIDYQPILSRLHQQNLLPGGVMLFMEPLGSNVLIRLYQLLSRSAHTPDERSLTKADIKWIEQTFPRFKFFPINWLSLPLGIISTFFFRSPDNLMMRFADKVDSCVASKAKFLRPSFRHAILYIPKTIKS